MILFTERMELITTSSSYFHHDQISNLPQKSHIYMIRLAKNDALTDVAQHLFDEDCHQNAT